MSDYFILKHGKPVRTTDIHEWGKFMEDINSRRVAEDHVEGGIRVSTVFLGIDHRYDSAPGPILWETMIFGGQHDQWQDRYLSESEARIGHQRALRIATGKEDPNA